LLTIITLIHRYQAELPRQRCKLYEKAVETLLTSWDSGKEIKLYSQVLLFLKSDDLLYILKKLAYWIHTQGSTGETEGGTLIDKDELIRQLRIEIQKITTCKTHEAKAEAERFVDFIQKRTGLLNEQGRDRYAFVHKTFQEYLTAEEIYEIDESGEDTEIIGKHFQDHLHDQHWREVLLLLVSKLKGKKAQNAIQTVLDAKSEYEQWLHRDLLFAGWCLTEDPSRLTTVAQDFVGEILDRLVELEVGDSDRIGGKIRGEVEKILHCFGETTVEKIIWEKLKGYGDRIDRFRLLEFQASLGQEAEVIETLLSLLRDEDSHARSRAAEAVGQMGNANPEAVETLLLLLRDEDSYVRSRTVAALGRLGNISPEVINSLLALLLCEKEWFVRSRAITALGQLGNTSPSVIDGLRSLLGGIDPRLNIDLAESLIKLGDTSPEVVNSLLSLLSDEIISTRIHAAKLLITLGVYSPILVGSLLYLLVDEGEPSVRIYSAELLVLLGRNNSELINSLLPLLKNQDKSVLILTSTVLIQLGNVTSQVVNALLPLFGNENYSSQYNPAAIALVHLGNSSVEVLKNLLPLINEKHSSLIKHAAKTLLQMSNPTPEVINTLLLLMRSEESYICQRAKETLVRLGKTLDNISPEVGQWLDINTDQGVRASEIDWGASHFLFSERKLTR
jgi:HEAT repeat protein